MSLGNLIPHGSDLIDENTVGPSKLATKPWIVNVVLTIVSVAFVLMALEIALIWILPDPIIWLEPQESYVNDPTLLYRLKPNHDAFTHSMPVRINSFGLRDREFSVKPDPNVRRILCLGDSLTFGNGVTEEDTYPRQLERLLTKTGPPGRRYEVINAGVPGYDTWQEARYLAQDGARFKPDLVIIGFYGNDIVAKPTDIKPVVEESGLLRKEGWQGLIPRRAIHLLKRSRILLLLRDRYEKLMLEWNHSREYDHQASLLTGRSNLSTEKGWKEVDEAFAMISAIAHREKFDILIVIFPLPDQVIREFPQATYPYKVREIAERHGIRFIDLLPVFKTEFHGFESLFIPWDGHPNSRAYGVAAREITKHISANDGRTNTHSVVDK
jgi:hypothetical protein